ncbi:MAG: hypothetical protein R3C11_20130 [Planctomycetaceae bacterium]
MSDTSVALNKPEQLSLYHPLDKSIRRIKLAMGISLGVYLLDTIALIFQFSYLGDEFLSQLRILKEDPSRTDIAVTRTIFMSTHFLFIASMFVIYVMSACFFYRAAMNLRAGPAPVSRGTLALFWFLGIPPVVNLFGTVLTVPVLYRESKVDYVPAEWGILNVLLLTLLLSPLAFIFFISFIIEGHMLSYVQTVLGLACGRFIRLCLLITVFLIWQYLITKIQRLQQAKYELKV